VKLVLFVAVVAVTIATAPPESLAYGKDMFWDGTWNFVYGKLQLMLPSIFS